MPRRNGKIQLTQEPILGLAKVNHPRWFTFTNPNHGGSNELRINQNQWP